MDIDDKYMLINYDVIIDESGNPLLKYIIRLYKKGKNNLLIKCRYDYNKDELSMDGEEKIDILITYIKKIKDADKLPRSIKIDLEKIVS